MGNDERKSEGKSSREYGAEGGKARAKRLTPEERREIAMSAAAARWGKEVLSARAEGVLTLGELSFPCAVLSDETRVLTETSFMKAMGIYRSGALSVRRDEEQGGRARIPLSLAFKNLKPFVDKHLGDVHQHTVVFRTKAGNIATSGIPATVIASVCEIWIDADRAGVLGARQKQIAHKADKLHRALAKTAIIALVDEATGYQAVRDQDTLARFLEQYIQEEYRQWMPTFPLSFFKELCRLRGIPFPANMQLPRYFGHWVNKLVWNRLAPGVRDELQRLNPSVNGRRKRKHHQYLTESIGHPKLLHHLGLLEGMGQAFAPGQHKEFDKAVLRAFPNYPALPLFADGQEKPKPLPRGAATSTSEPKVLSAPA